jgi:hypothetical protein
LQNILELNKGLEKFIIPCVRPELYDHQTACMVGQQTGEAVRRELMYLEKRVKDIYEINQEIGRIKSVAVVGNSNYEKTYNR